MHRSSVITNPARLSRLRRTGLLDSGREPAYERLTTLVSTVLAGKLSLLSLVDGDRRYFKSCAGLRCATQPCRETPLTNAICTLLVDKPEPLAISDVRQDPRATKDPMVREFGVVAYLGVPLITTDEHVLGALCVTDDKARDWSEKEVALLQDLAATVMSEIHLREEVHAHQRAERRLRLHLEVTEILASDVSLTEGIDRILRVIAEELGFTAGELWRASKEDDKLHCIGFWRAESERLEDFENATRQWTVARGEALIGKVWAESRPVWTTNLSTDLSFARREVAMAGGLRSSFAFPVSSGETDGVMCFFGPESWQPDTTLQLSLAGLGQQLGAFIQQRWGAAQASESGDFLRRVSEELSKSEQRFRQLCDLAPVGIFQTDEHGRCTFVNEQWRRFTGLTNEQAIGDGWAGALHRDFAYVYNRWRKVAPTGVQFSTEFRFECTDGQTAWVYGQTVPLRSDDGTVVGHIGVLRDISVYKHAEEAMRLRKTAAEQANEAKSRFLANMSHEVRTPLNGILGLTNMLLDTELQPSQRKIADLVLGSAESLLVIVNDILDFSKVEGGHLELEQIDYDLQEMLGSVLQLHQSRAIAKRLTLESEISPDLPPRLRGDPARLQQVLNNLVSNAMKFSENGRICISVDLVEQSPEPNLLRFSVSDEGPGIPPDAQERIFDPFAQADASTTRRYGGTGLGLSICKQLVELMGGTIDVQSELGHGAIFSFTAPYCDPLQLGGAPADLVITEETVAMQPKQNTLALRVLLAEDNSINRLVAVNQLEKLGCIVDSVEDGQAAVEAALHTAYDLIFMDCHMPVLDGYNATREIRDRWTRPEPARIIALTANAMQGERERCLACGMDEYLSKPVDVAGLRRAMAAVLPAATLKRASQPIEVPSPDRGTVLEALHGMDADGVDVQLVVRLFREEAVIALSRVEKALEVGDSDEIWRAAHKLKGTAAEMGAESLRDKWGKLEECARSGDLEQSAKFFRKAKAELEQVTKVLDDAPISAPPLDF